MAYQKTNWEKGMVISSDGLNNLEDGISILDDELQDLDTAIPIDITDNIGKINLVNSMSPINLTGAFAGLTANAIKWGNMMTVYMYGKLVSGTVIPKGDIVIGTLGADYPIPYRTARSAIFPTTPSNMPSMSVRVGIEKNITILNLVSYTVESNVLVNFEVTFPTVEIFTNLDKSQYSEEKIISQSPAQGAAHTSDYYFAIQDNGTNPISLAVYNRNTGTSKSIPTDWGVLNTGNLGHANSLAVLRDDSQTTGDIFIGATVMVKAGIQVFKYNVNNDTVALVSYLTPIPDNGANSNDLHLTTIQLNGNELFLKSYESYWKGIIDVQTIENTQNIPITEIAKTSFTDDSYANLVGNNLSTIMSVQQSDHLYNNRIYTIRTMNGYKTNLAIVVEATFDTAESGITPTGKYWFFNYPQYYNNEIESVWVEDNILYGNVNIKTPDGSTNQVVNIGKIQ